MNVTTCCVTASTTNVNLVMQLSKEYVSICLRTTCTNQTGATSSHRSNLQAFRRGLAFNIMWWVNFNEVCT